jgi:hypothetical protein
MKAEESMVGNHNLATASEDIDDLCVLQYSDL